MGMLHKVPIQRELCKAPGFCEAPIQKTFAETPYIGASQNLYTEGALQSD